MVFEEEVSIWGRSFMSNKLLSGEEDGIFGISRHWWVKVSIGIRGKKFVSINSNHISILFKKYLIYLTLTGLSHNAMVRTMETTIMQPGINPQMVLVCI